LGENTGYNRKTQNVGDLFNFLGAVLYQGVTGKQVDLSFMYPPDVKQKLDEAYGPTPEQQAPAAPTVASAGAEAAMMAIRNLADLLEQGNLEPFAERGTNADSPLYVYDTSRDDAGFGFAPRAFFFRGRIGTPRTTAGPQTLGASV
jgi:hypothetical protein